MVNPMNRMGDTPHILHGVQEDYRHLYKSNPEAALRTDMTIRAGYGLLKSGTVLAKNLSAASDGKLVPYNPTTFTGAEVHPGRAYLVADSGTAVNVVSVSMDDSYKFKVGDDLIINSTGVSAENLGAITAIDRTTYPHLAVITFTTNIGGSAFTVATAAYVCVEAGISANNYSDGFVILEKSVNTGIGINSQGANSDVILGNYLLYEGMLDLLDAAAKTDLSAVSVGQFLMIR